MRIHGFWMLFVIGIVPLATYAQEEPIDIGPLFEPEPVPFTFETPGWYLLASALVIALLFFAYLLVKKYLKNGYRRAGIKYLERINKRFQEQQDTSCFTDVLVLLKQVAFKAYGRDQAANLYGIDWILFLESKCKNTPFSDYDQVFVSTLYREQPIHKDDFQNLLDLSKKWIRHHA